MSGWSGLGENDIPQEVIVLREKLSAKETAIAGYETQLQRRAQEYDDLKQQFDDAINKLRGESERVLTLEGELRHTQDDLRREKIHVENIETTLASAQQAAKSANMSTRELEATLETLSQQSHTHQERNKALEREKGKLEERIREMQVLLSQSALSSTAPLRKQTHRRSSSLNTFRISTLETDINDTKVTLQQREKELEVLSKKLSAAQAEANRLSNEKNALEKKTNAHIAELEASLADREEELAYLRDTESGAGREQELLDRIDEDEAKIAALEAMVSRAQDIEEVEANLRHVEKQLEEECRRTRRLAEQQLNLKEENENLILELNETRAHVQTLENEKGRQRRTSLLSNMDADMDQDAPVEAPEEDDNTGPLPDEGTVAYVERLLAAINRLRDERDGLRRDVAFLESESRFAIQALEDKLSRSMATAASESEGQTVRTMNQMKMEMDALHSHLEDVQGASEVALRRKEEEIWRLGQTVLALGVVINHGSSSDSGIQTTSQPCTVDSVRLEELEDELDAILAQRDDLAETLIRKEAAWEEEYQGLRLHQQQSNRNIADLHSEIDDLTKTVEKIDSERSSLVIHVQNLEADLEAVQQELAKAESRYSDLQFHQLSSMSSTEATQNLRAQITTLEGRVQRRTEQLGIHQHDVRRLEANLRLQEERLIEMTTELEMMSAEKEAMVEDCADARESRDGALARVEELEEATERLEATAEEGERTIVTLIGVIAETVSKARQAIQNTSTGTSNNMTTEVSADDLHDTLELVEELKEENAHLEHNVQVYNERINQLTAQIVSLEGQHDTTLAQAEEAKKDLEERISTLENDIEELHKAKEELEETNSTATRELQGELDRLRQRLNDSEETLRRSAQVEDEQQAKSQDVERLEARVSELQGTLDDSEAQHAGQLEELHEELHALSEAKRQLEDEVTALREEFAVVVSEHQREASVLQEELMKERQNFEQAQESFDDLEEERRKLVEDMNQLRQALQASQDELATTKDKSSKSAEQYRKELDALTAQIHELSGRIQEEQSRRQAEAAEHHATVESLKAQYEAAVSDLQKDMKLLREDCDETDRARMVAEQERNAVQEELTDLVAKVEQSKSMQRAFDTQIAERERTIAALQADINDIQVKLDNAEQASAKATLNISLLTAQHKRELADAQKELERLRSNGNLEQVTAELHERNQEMEQLLKQKCAEIEENDDRTLEMLKENKKLSTKVDTLTRKVQALQSKVATLKANSPKSEAKTASGSTSKPSPLSATSAAPTTSRQRSQTSTSSQQLAHPAAQTQRPSMPSSSTSLPLSMPSASSTSTRPLTRVSSVSSAAALKTKTPEKPRAPVQLFRSKTPENPRASTSPVGETESVAGKKRRAPDDFEVCDSMPPQAFTADSLPKGDHADSRTPRVRRALSTLQSGFTPVRHFGAIGTGTGTGNSRPVAPLPSPRRLALTTSTQSPFMAENSPMNVVPPLAFAPPSASKSSSNKRSWLGKIRGAGTGQGMSRS